LKRHSKVRNDAYLEKAKLRLKQNNLSDEVVLVLFHLSCKRAAAVV